MPQPLVSFIVTTYYLPSSLLEECLESILSLSLSRDEREIILVDDGSDNSPIDQLTHRDEIIYVRQSNQGLSTARNKGLQWAQGKYIQFVDGDDFLLSAPYEHCLDFVRFEHPDMVLFNTTTDKRPHTSFTDSLPMSGVAFMQSNNVRASSCSYIFSKQTLGGLKFEPGIYHEDEAFTPQLLIKCRRVFDLDAKAYYYRRRQGSITHSLSSNAINKRLDDTLHIIMYLKAAASKYHKEAQLAMERRVAQLTMDYLYNIVTLTHSKKRLDEAIGSLQKENLFPLPNKKYTHKYTLFRKMADSVLGRRLLLIALRRKN